MESKVVSNESPPRTSTKLGQYNTRSLVKPHPEPKPRYHNSLGSTIPPSHCQSINQSINQSKSEMPPITCYNSHCTGYHKKIKRICYIPIYKWQGKHRHHETKIREIRRVCQTFGDVSSVVFTRFIIISSLCTDEEQQAELTNCATQASEATDKFVFTSIVDERPHHVVTHLERRGPIEKWPMTSQYLSVGAIVWVIISLLLLLGPHFGGLEES